MAVDGGNWIWTAAFRYYWMIPLLMILLAFKGQLKPLFKEMQKNPLQWLLWGTVGFGVFYSLLTFSAEFSPGWLVASIWQTTIIAGVLLAPFINKIKTKISPKTLIFSGVILLGVIVMQIGHAKHVTQKELLLGSIPILIAAVAYPLGNRKMMQITAGKLSAMQRLLGMTLASLPFWFLLSFFAVAQGSYPSETQLFQTFIVAVSSGIIATTLFFKATDSVQHDEKTLGAVEATQSTELIFALIGEMIILNSGLPDIFGFVGMGFVILGMILHSFSH